MSDVKHYCRFEGCEERTFYSETAARDHVTRDHGLSIVDRRHIETGGQRDARGRREEASGEWEQRRRDAVSAWEGDQLADELEAIETVDDFLRACGSTS